MIERGDLKSSDPLHTGPYVKISKSGDVERYPLYGDPVLEEK